VDPKIPQQNLRKLKGLVDGHRFGAVLSKVLGEQLEQRWGVGSFGELL